MTPTTSVVDAVRLLSTVLGFFSVCLSTLVPANVEEALSGSQKAGCFDLCTDKRIHASPHLTADLREALNDQHDCVFLQSTESSHQIIEK